MRFHVQVDGFVYAEDIEGAMREVGLHFLEVAHDGESAGRFGAASQIEIQPKPERGSGPVQ